MTSGYLMNATPLNMKLCLLEILVIQSISKEIVNLIQ